MDTLIHVTIALILLALALGLFTGLVWFGFRMGRQSIDKPMAPIVQKKQEPFVEEDPYYEPMHGVPQSQPTVEGR